ncbi:MAG: sulfatase [Planctomycetota bacterium]
MRTLRSGALCSALALITLGPRPAAPAAGLGAPGGPDLEDVNVVVICIDTFGAEHAGAFLNPELAHTPHMDALAARGVVFRRAYAPSPWTQPSVASLFTGSMPSRHGIMQMTDVLRDHQVTLAEAFKERGFVTGAVISNFILRPRFGFSKGFDSYQTRPALASAAGITSAKVTDRSIEWIKRNADSRFFLFAHYFDPHYAYMHHPEFDRTSNYEGSLRPAMPIGKLRDARNDLTPEDVRYLIDLHHEEIAFTDAQIGRLLGFLREQGLEEKTLVVLTSDHGEEFMRHGWIGHTRTLYEELLHVPMIVSLPGTFGPATVDDPVSLVDVKPTLLAMSSVADDAPCDGFSLLPYLLGTGAPAAGRMMLGEVSAVPVNKDKFAHEKIAFKTSLLSGSMKVIHDLSGDTWELYDLANDPEELNDLAASGHEAFAELRANLETWEEVRAPEGEAGGAPSELSDEELERLRQLGYVK